MKRLWDCGISLAIAASGLLLFSFSIQAASGAPPITHSVVGRNDCLSCHSASGVRPVPQDHASFTNATCLSCHTVAPVSSSPVPSSSAPFASVLDSACLACHGKSGMTMTLADGETISISVDTQELAASVHGGKLMCTDCHTTITGYPHPKVTATTKREFSETQYELCKTCHFVEYTKTLDSIHYTLQSQGNLAAPLCTDCHGAHDVMNPSQPRTKISNACGQCHQDVYQQYATSVHGSALIEDNNYDVPVCTDCHTAHTIADPLTASFRVQSVTLCSNCHGNAKLMAKYGLSTSVVNSYLQDFHGRSVALIGVQGKDIWPAEAVCTDCHGVHDIQAVNSTTSPVIQANLLATCQKCHTNATANFTGAWLSHYEPDLHHAPLVWAVGWMYKILIPFIVVGLSIHILLDIWRTVTNR